MADLRHHHLAALLLLTTVGAAVDVIAQPLPRMTRLTDGVYMYEHADPTKAGVTANNLVVVGTRAVLVADGQGTVENTGHLIAAIAAITPVPVRYVVVGSEHGDHRGGDTAFPETATFIAHPASKAALETQSALPARRANAAPVVVPTETVSDARTVDLGGREAEIRFLGRAHTGGDLVVLLPRERIVFMSEAFISGIFPSMANGFPSEWADVLRRAEALDVEVLVPAHGLMSRAAETSRSAVTVYRQAIEQVLAEGRRLHDASVAVAEASSLARLGTLTALHRYADNVAGALGRVYAELDGRLPPP
jgi:cyclase